MLVDTRAQSPGGLLRTDVCIIGTGPAGLTIAREMSDAGFRVCLLESGGEHYDAQAQTASEGRVESAQGYRSATVRDGRRRQWGGTANLWNHSMHGAGKNFIRYVPLDGIDFESREGVPHSGWPFTRQTLAPYYERAAALCGVGSGNSSAGFWSGNDPARQPWETPELESVVSQFGTSQVFLDDLRRKFAASENVTVLLHARLHRFERDHGTTQIRAAEAVITGGNSLRILAGQFVLAAGGLENSRILLLQDAAGNGGLGNQHDNVGRYFMDHPSITLGTLHPFSKGIFSKAGFYDQHTSQGHQIMGKLHIRPEVQRREKLLNLCAVLVPHFRHLWSSPGAVLSQILEKGPRYLRNRPAHAVDDSPAADCFHLPGTLQQKLLEGYYSECHAGWSLRPDRMRCFGKFGVRSLVEQSPDPANRVMLDDTLDDLGQRKIKVVWRWNEIDLRSVRRSQEIFQREMAAAGIGNFEPTPESDGGQPRDFFSPHHFLGGTRIHANPRQGVVDANCQVHGLDNLFIAGSSVFPTGGFANPTFTVLALGIRLADYLIKRAKEDASIHLPTVHASKTLPRRISRFQKSRKPVRRGSSLALAGKMSGVRKT